MGFAIALNRTSPTPLRRQIYDDWRQAILTARLRHRGASAVHA
jgi:hypothetical protein